MHFLVILQFCCHNKLAVNDNVIACTICYNIGGDLNTFGFGLLIYDMQITLVQNIFCY